MIYQCYFKKEQEPLLFKQHPYIGFGLEPEVNSELFLNCPELESKSTRLHLTEYACFLWHWRNPDRDSSNWFGTTSYRQLDKTKFMFHDSFVIEKLAKENSIAAWGVYELLNARGDRISIHRQSEVCHPGINEFMNIALEANGKKIPDLYNTSFVGAFANYWVMNKAMFNQYMEYSWPLVNWALNNINNFEYFKTDMPGKTVTKDKAIGYFAERLFITWYLENNHKIVSLGPIMPLYHNTL